MHLYVYIFIQLHVHNIQVIITSIVSFVTILSPLSLLPLDYRIPSLLINEIVTRQFPYAENKNVSNFKTCPHRFNEKT